MAPRFRHLFYANAEDPKLPIIFVDSIPADDPTDEERARRAEVEEEDAPLPPMIPNRNDVRVFIPKDPDGNPLPPVGLRVIDIQHHEDSTLVVLCVFDPKATDQIYRVKDSLKRYTDMMTAGMNLLGGLQFDTRVEDTDDDEDDDEDEKVEANGAAAANA